MDSEIKRLPVRYIPVHKRQCVVSDNIGDITRRPDRHAVPDHGSIVVHPTAALMNEPVAETMLWNLAVAEMPLAAQTTGIAVSRQYVRISNFFLEVRSGIRTGVAASDPIVNTVLGCDAAGQQSCPAGGADWCGDEEVVETHPGGRDMVDAGCTDLRVAVTTGSPDALVIGQDAHNIG